MDNTEKARELINKHLHIHCGDGLGITDGDVYRAVLDAVIEALTITDVVGQSKQFLCECCVDNLVEECGDWCDECLENPSRVIIK